MAAARTLRDSAGLRFDQMIDLCGMDYRTYGDGRWDGLRYAVTVQLLSVQLNHRLRVKIFAPDDGGRYFSGWVRIHDTSARRNRCPGKVAFARRAVSVAVSAPSTRPATSVTIP